MNSSGVRSPRAQIVLALATVLLHAQTQQYISDRYRYNVSLPANWHISVNGSGIPTVFNYAPSEGGPQGLFPEQGAQITIIPSAAVQIIEGPKTLEDWANSGFNARRTKLVLRHLPRGNTSAGGARDVIEVQANSWRDPQDDEPERELSYYFILNGAMFRIMLVYWADNPNGPMLEAATKSMLDSMRVLRGNGR